MRPFLLIAWLIFCSLPFAAAQVSITKSPTGWELDNGHIRLVLARSSDAVQMTSLRREGGTEWAVSGTPMVAVPDKSGKHYTFTDDSISDLDKGASNSLCVSNPMPVDCFLLN